MHEIRVANPGDASAAWSLICRSVRECCTADHHNNPAAIDRWLRYKTPEIIQGWFSWPSHFAAVVVENDIIIGVGMLSRRGKISLLYVAPDKRHGGVGTMLLKALECHAARIGTRAIRLASTLTAKTFYERHGYVFLKTTRAEHGIAPLMGRRLKPERGGRASTRNAASLVPRFSLLPPLAPDSAATASPITLVSG